VRIEGDCEGESERVSNSDLFGYSFDQYLHRSDNDRAKRLRRESLQSLFLLEL